MSNQFVARLILLAALLAGSVARADAQDTKRWIVLLVSPTDTAGLHTRIREAYARESLTVGGQDDAESPITYLAAILGTETPHPSVMLRVMVRGSIGDCPSVPLGEPLSSRDRLEWARLRHLAALIKGGELHCDMTGPGVEMCR